jgi:uncharacterized membrane protein
MSTLAEAITVKCARLESVDLLRGVVMVIMALDHTRDFFGRPGSPTNLATASAALFFTRWITNFCAPVFFLLTGTGAWLSLRKQSRSELSRFLLTRGVWLIFLELVLFRCLVVQFNFDYHVTAITVLWALGWAMIVLSALVYLPPSVVTGFGVVMIATHNLFDSVRSSNPLWSILHSPNIIFSTPTHTVFVAYPLIPWIGVTAAGYGLGQIYGWASDRRRTFLLRLGIVLTSGFVILRAINIYGDPSRWTTQPSAAFTALSFLNTTKYPPSLLFLLMTLGPALIFRWAVDTHTHRVCCAPRSSSARFRCSTTCCTSPSFTYSPSSSVTRVTCISTGCSNHPTSRTFPSLSLRDGDSLCRSSISSGPSSCSRCIHSAAGSQP